MVSTARCMCGLRTSYPEIVSTLHEIAEDLNEKSLTRTEALGLYYSLATLEICFIALFWIDISNRFNAKRDPEVFDDYEKKAIETYSLIAQLKKQNDFYIKLNEKFGFLARLHNLNSIDIEE
ncbi:hypothetical protein TSAR_015558 [Trichomalopsis sarcophagae]|uniref:Uncharacterized protein n=1 Tax=Trichomalopsis sarcophagae TaxID=543379 RepID=A0A232EI62_9HYME|nr:hypothetical protein TSAR_015558 [Trichomalopsis sarcophagae]